MCGYSIDIIKEEELQNPVRAKRLRYLTTRDQVCPNCINTIAKCEKVETEEEGIPVIRVAVDEGNKAKLIDFCRKNGYAVATDYALNESKGRN